MSARNVGPNRPSITWMIFRVALLAAAVSLGAYIPYKYATQLHATEGLYAFLFPLSSVLVIAGIALSVKPELAFRVPLLGRAAIGALAGGWIATGMLCIPSLTKQTLQSPGAGLFATFHMLTQHVFLSLGIAALVLVPAATFALFGVGYTMSAARSCRAKELSLPSNP